MVQLRIDGEHAMGYELKIRRTVSILVVLLGLTGCSGSDQLSPGTETMVTGDNSISTGVKVRVVEDPGGPTQFRNVRVYVLEGAHKDETLTIQRDHLTGK
jgi:hypothetical protein